MLDTSDHDRSRDLLFVESVDELLELSQRDEGHLVGDLSQPGISLFLYPDHDRLVSAFFYLFSYQ